MGFSDEVKTMCESLAQSRSDRDKAMKELHSDFSRDRTERKQGLKRLFSDFSRDRTERKQGLKRLFGDVHVMIQHFHTDRGKMSKELRQMLEGYFEGIRKDTKALMNQLRGQSQAVRKEARGMIREYRADFKKARGYWMAFAERMQQARRTGRSAPSRMKAGPMARIMEALKGSSEGMTLKELSYAMGMPEKGLKPALARMRRQRHIRKRKNAFFAA